MVKFCSSLPLELSILSIHCNSSLYSIVNEDHTFLKSLKLFFKSNGYSPLSFRLYILFRSRRDLDWPEKISIGQNR